MARELKVYGKWAGNSRGTPEDTTKCIKTIWGGPCSHGRQCSRKRGYGEGGLYCKQHDPENVEQKRVLEQEKYEAESKARQDKYDRRRFMSKLAEGIPTEEISKYKLVLKE